MSGTSWQAVAESLKTQPKVQSDSDTETATGHFHLGLCGPDSRQFDVPLTQKNISAGHK